MLLTAQNVSDLPNIASRILAFDPNERVFLFYGEMGAGKTTLIKSLCKQLGSADNITSPTFSIVNEYTGNSNGIYHFDFYRLKNETEAMDIGFEEYLHTGSYCFIEWPEKIPNLLPPGYISINISVLAYNSRQLRIDKILV